MALVIVARQYARRGTAISRCLAGAAFAMAFATFLLLPWPAAFAIQSWFSRPIEASAVRVGFDPGLKWAARAFINRNDKVDLDIPLKVTDVPQALELRPDGITATVEGSGGAVWRADRQPWSQVRAAAGLTSLHARLDAAFYRQIRNGPVRITGVFYATLYGNLRRAVLPVRKQAIFGPAPGVGLCSATESNVGVLLNCRSAFRDRWTVMFDFLTHNSALTRSYPRPVSYSPFPADFGLMPVTESIQYVPPFPGQGPITGVSVYAVEPVAHLRRVFEITGLRLADYELAR